MNTYRISVILTAVLSAVAIIAAVTIGGCSSSIETAAGTFVPMKCHWTAKIAAILSVIPLIMSAAAFFCRTKEGRCLCSAAVIICAAVIFITTTSAGIGICAAIGMKCSNMAMLLRADMVLVAVLSVLGIVFSGRMEKRQKRRL